MIIFSMSRGRWGLESPRRHWRLVSFTTNFQLSYTFQQGNPGIRSTVIARVIIEYLYFNRISLATYPDNTSTSNSKITPIGPLLSIALWKNAKIVLYWSVFLDYLPFNCTLSLHESFLSTFWFRVGFTVRVGCSSKEVGYTTLARFL